jgi:hypothetical protein
MENPEPRPDLAALIGMIGEGRIAELTDVELVAVVMMTAPEHAAEVLETILPGAGQNPSAGDLMKPKAKEGDNFTIEKLQLHGLAEFMRRYRAEKGIIE